MIYIYIYIYMYFFIRRLFRYRSTQRKSQIFTIVNFDLNLLWEKFGSSQECCRSKFAGPPRHIHFRCRSLAKSKRAHRAGFSFGDPPHAHSACVFPYCIPFGRSAARAVHTDHHRTFGATVTKNWAPGGTLFSPP